MRGWGENFSLCPDRGSNRPLQNQGCAELCFWTLPARGEAKNHSGLASESIVSGEEGSKLPFLIVITLGLAG